MKTKLDELIEAANKLALEVEDQLDTDERERGGVGMSKVALRYKLNTFDKIRSEYEDQAKHAPKSDEVTLAEARLKWLHTNEERDEEGYEWGIFRVKWNEHGQPVSVMQTFSDFSDLDAEMAREARAAIKARKEAGL